MGPVELNDDKTGKQVLATGSPHTLESMAMVAWSVGNEELLPLIGNVAFQHTKETDTDIASPPEVFDLTQKLVRDNEGVDTPNELNVEIQPEPISNEDLAFYLDLSQNSPGQPGPQGHPGQQG